LPVAASAEGVPAAAAACGGGVGCATATATACWAGVWTVRCAAAAAAASGCCPGLLVTCKREHRIRRARKARYLWMRMGAHYPEAS
jgi:hypothetical protein